MLVSPSFDPEKVFSLAAMFDPLIKPIPINNHLEPLTPLQMSPYREPSPEEKRLVNQFRENRADILASTEALLLAAITPDKAAGSTIKDLAVSMEKLNAMERLDRGQSTSNVELLINSVEKIASTRLTKVSNNNNSNKGIDNSNDNAPSYSIPIEADLIDKGNPLALSGHLYEPDTLDFSTRDLSRIVTQNEDIFV